MNHSLAIFLWLSQVIGLVTATSGGSDALIAILSSSFVPQSLGSSSNPVHCNPLCHGVNCHYHRPAFARNLIRATITDVTEEKYTTSYSKNAEKYTKRTSTKNSKKVTTENETTTNKRRNWAEHYALLVEFHEEHGHANVPYRYEKDPKLGHWLMDQRRRRVSLKPEKFAQLDALNIVWDGVENVKSDQQWKNMFQHLEMYKEIEGHCCVPSTYEPNQKLANWVYTQRRFNKLGKIKPDRFQRLESIGFVWRLQTMQSKNRTSEIWEQQWNQKFNELREYQKENGHCRVPQGSNEYPELAAWVNGQRQWDIEGRLRPDRKRQLDGIGFTWDFEEIFDEAWMNMYNQLIELEKKQQIGGDGNNLQRQTWADQNEQLDLYNWEKSQQDYFKRGTLDPQREAMLAEIGYHWGSLGLIKGGSGSKIP